jgi:hypothetical protein
MKASPDLKQARDTPPNQNATLGRLRDAAQDFEERAFSSTVAANDPNDFTPLYFETDVLERPELLDLIALNDLSPAEHVDCLAPCSPDLWPSRYLFDRFSTAMTASDMVAQCELKSGPQSFSPFF